MSDPAERRRFQTRAVHIHRPPPPEQLSSSMPIYQSSTFRFETNEEFARAIRFDGPGYVYSRGYGNPTVDAKLVGLALRREAGILTTDYNLNRVAQLQGVRILNVNQLANALKPAFLPGEPLRVKVIQEGKEPGQGVAFLDDGTMVVVEGGSKHIASELDVTVTRILQTVAGRMVFAELAGRGTYRLTPDERAAIEESKAQVRRGELATDEEVEAAYRRFRE